MDAFGPGSSGVMGINFRGASDPNEDMAWDLVEQGFMKEDRVEAAGQEDVEGSMVDTAGAGGEGDRPDAVGAYETAQDGAASGDVGAGTGADRSAHDPRADGVVGGDPPPPDVNDMMADASPAANVDDVVEEPPPPFSERVGIWQRAGRRQGGRAGGASSSTGAAEGRMLFAAGLDATVPDRANVASGGEEGPGALPEPRGSCGTSLRSSWGALAGMFLEAGRGMLTRAGTRGASSTGAMTIRGSSSHEGEANPPTLAVGRDTLKTSFPMVSFGAKRDAHQSLIHDLIDTHVNGPPGCKLVLGLQGGPGCGASAMGTTIASRSEFARVYKIDAPTLMMGHEGMEAAYVKAVLAEAHTQPNAVVFVDNVEDVVQLVTVPPQQYAANILHALVTCCGRQPPADSRLLVILSSSQPGFLAHRELSAVCDFQYEFEALTKEEVQHAVEGEQLFSAEALPLAMEHMTEQHVPVKTLMRCLNMFKQKLVDTQEARLTVWKHTLKCCRLLRPAQPGVQAQIDPLVDAVEGGLQAGLPAAV